MNKTVTLASAVIALILGTVSMADVAPEFPAPPAFAEVDSDGDLQVSRDEFRAFMEQRISGHEGRVRVLHDRVSGEGPPMAMGALSRFPAPLAFAELDANGDMLITEDEFQAFTEQRASERKSRFRCISDGPDPFDRADVDGDGQLSQEEFDTTMGKVRIFRTGD